MSKLFAFPELETVQGGAQYSVVDRNGVNPKLGLHKLYLKKTGGAKRFAAWFTANFTMRREKQIED
jgi:hypothetical protein